MPAPQLLAFRFRADFEFPLAEPTPAAAQLAARLDPALVLGVAARTGAAIGRRRAELLGEDMQLR